jgi:Uma2 family endonuclease
MGAVAGLTLSRDDFYAWAEAQPRGRFERINGEVIQMSPERWRHARLKAQIWRAVEDALTDIPSCRVVPDGMAVQIDDDTDFEPDVAIHRGDPIPPDSVFIPNPIVVVEALSPGTGQIDKSVKADGYLRTATIAHSLIFRADRREVTLISRAEDARQQFREGALIRLDSPGITLDIDAIYTRAEA